MENTIDPTALYWASFERFELRLPGQCVLDCSHQGDCAGDVAYWVPRIRAQAEQDGFPNGPTDEKIAQELRDCGAWDDDELADRDQNWHRLVWIAACNIQDDDERDCSAPSCPSPAGWDKVEA